MATLIEEFSNLLLRIGTVPHNITTNIIQVASLLLDVSKQLNHLVEQPLQFDIQPLYVSSDSN